MQTITLPADLVQGIAVYLQSHLTCDELTTKKAMHVNGLLSALLQAGQAPAAVAEPPASKKG